MLKFYRCTIIPRINPLSLPSSIYPFEILHARKRHSSLDCERSWFKRILIKCSAPLPPRSHQIEFLIEFMSTRLSCILRSKHLSPRKKTRATGCWSSQQNFESFFKCDLGEFIDYPSLQNSFLKSLDFFFTGEQIFIQSISNFLNSPVFE